MKFITVTATYQYVCVMDDDEDEYAIAEEYARDAMNDLGTFGIDYDIVDGIVAVTGTMNVFRIMGTETLVLVNTRK
jgi:hypothetical protein